MPALEMFLSHMSILSYFHVIPSWLKIIRFLRRYEHFKLFSCYTTEEKFAVLLTS